LTSGRGGASVTHVSIREPFRDREWIRQPNAKPQVEQRHQEKRSDGRVIGQILEERGR
jgi:hypothetical protein